MQARGIETYFLSFAMNPEAEAVAARENATSGQAMHSLPDIVRAIALNNKINESRDLAETVQRSMAKRLGAKNRALRDLGVKQAPFVVLIGAVMLAGLAPGSDRALVIPVDEAAGEGCVELVVAKPRILALDTDQPVRRELPVAAGLQATHQAGAVIAEYEAVEIVAA